MKNNIFFEYKKIIDFFKNTKELVTISIILFSVSTLVFICNLIPLFINKFLGKQTGILMLFENFFYFENDGFFPDFYQSGLFFSSSVLLLLVFLFEKEKIYLFFSSLFFFVWFSTSFNYHTLTVKKIRPILDVDLQNFTFELLAWLPASIFFLIFSIPIFRKLKVPDYGISLLLFLSFCSLCFFAICIDYFHEISTSFFNFFLMLIEESGELFSATSTFLISLTALLFKTKKKIRD